MNKIRCSGKLLKAAFAVLFREKKLLLFPFIATGFALVVAAFFIAPIAFYPTGHSYFSGAHWSALAEMFTRNMDSAERHHQPPMFNQYGFVMFFSKHWWLTVLLAVAYFVSMFLATFCNVAFYHEIMQALNGNTISIRRGFQFAKTRWRAVLLWSLFAGLVGYIIQTIEQRVGFLGKIIAGLIGFAWSVACIFIIPTLVRDTENSNPIKLLRVSAGTLRRTWGETIVGFVGIGILSALSMFTMIAGILLVIGIPMFVFAGSNPKIEPKHLMYFEGGIFLTAVLVATLLSYLGGMLNSIYRCALYIYATEGVVPGTFDKELLDSAWKVK
jgi:hypothetical protein